MGIELLHTSSRPNISFEIHLPRIQNAVRFNLRRLPHQVRDEAILDAVKPHLVLFWAAEACGQGLGEVPELIEKRFGDAATFCHVQTLQLGQRLKPSSLQGVTFGSHPSPGETAAVTARGRGPSRR